MCRCTPLLILALLACPATADDGENRWTSSEHNLKLQLPSSWKMRTGKAQVWGTEDGILEGVSADGNAACILASEDLGQATQEYVKNWETITKESKKLEKHYEREIDRGEGQWRRVEYTWESDKHTFVYLGEFVSVGDRTYRLIIWYLKSMEKDFRGDADTLLKGFGQLVKKAVPPPSPKDAAKPWTSDVHGLGLTVPSGWTARSGKAMEWGADGGILEGLSRDGNGAFMLAYEDLGLKSEAYLAQWEKVQRQDKKLTRLSKKRTQPGDRFRAEYDWAHKPTTLFVYIAEVFTVGKRTYRLIVWYLKSQDAAFRPDANTIFDSFRPVLKPEKDG